MTFEEWKNNHPVMKSDAQHIVKKAIMEVSELAWIDAYKEGFADGRTMCLGDMDKIVNDIPSAMEYETDARDTWPKRWAELKACLGAEAALNK